MNVDYFIQNAKKLTILDEKHDYLRMVERYFLLKRKYREASKIAEYMLNELTDTDNNSIKIRLS